MSVVVALSETPFYEEWWFLIVMALISLIFILMVVFGLLMLGQNKKYRSCGTGRTYKNHHCYDYYKRNWLYSCISLILIQYLYTDFIYSISFKRMLFETCMSLHSLLRVHGITTIFLKDYKCLYCSCISVTFGENCKIKENIVNQCLLA